MLVKRVKAVPEPNQSLKLAYIGYVKSLLDEDLDRLISCIHPNGIRDGSKTYSRPDLHRVLAASLSKLDYTLFTLSEVIDFDRLQAKKLNKDRFRLTAPTKVKYVGRELYFDDTLELVFERGQGDDDWLIVELD
jgi:hypothetical protein